MGQVTIIEPNITPEENERNWEVVKSVMQLIADEMFEKMELEEN